MDKIEENLECVYFSWHLTSAQSDLLLAAKELGLIPAGAIRVTVHTTPQITMISATEKEDPCQIQDQRL